MGGRDGQGRGPGEEAKKVFMQRYYQGNRKGRMKGSSKERK